jgi:hypothetical protein
MHRSETWWQAFGSLWCLGCLSDRSLCRYLHVDRESYRLQKQRRRWKKETETTLDDLKKNIAEQEDREWRIRRGSVLSERIRLRWDERYAEFNAQLAYLRTIKP